MIDLILEFTIYRILDVISGERRIKCAELKPGDEMIVGFMSWTIKDVLVREDGLVSINCYGYGCAKPLDETVRIKKRKKGS